VARSVEVPISHQYTRLWEKNQDDRHVNGGLSRL